MTSETNTPQRRESEIQQREDEIQRRESGGFGLWYSVASGPVLWAAHLSISYALASNACQHGFLVDASLLGINALTLSLVLITLVFLAAVAYGGWLAYRGWRELRDTSRGMGVPDGQRTRFLTFSGMLLNVLFFGAILMTIAPTLFFNPCS
jgi:hypothetical protein